MFQVNFEEQQNGVKIKRRLFDMLFVSKTVAIEEINMGTFMALKKTTGKSDFCPALFFIFEKEKKNLFISFNWQKESTIRY